MCLDVHPCASSPRKVCTGAGKSEHLAKVLGVAGKDEPMLPAGRVKPTDGALVWFVDNAASEAYSAISAASL